MKNTKSIQNNIVPNTRSIWINLTNGLEWLGNYRLKHEDFGFVRIPSTWCEQKLFWKILEALPPEFYLTAAQGKVDLIVFDASKHTESRALWQGCSFIEYAINRCWTGKIIKQIDRNKSADKYFDYLYRNLPKSTKSVLKYYKKFVPEEWQDNGKLICMVHIACIYTEHDGDYKYFAERLQNYLTNFKE